MRTLKSREDRISKGSEDGSEMLKEAPGQRLKTPAGLANQRSLVNSRILSAEMTEAKMDVGTLESEWGTPKIWQFKENK